MKTQRLYSCLTLAALMGIWSCSSSRQTAQNTGEVDDLYGNSGNAEVYASNRQSDGYSDARPSRQQQRYDRQQERSLRNANPDYADDQQYGSNGSTNSGEYYTELSARKLNRGISPDPGWSDAGANAYTSGFANGYNSAMTSAYSWNRWGFNNMGFYSGLGMGMMGMGGYGGYNSFGFGNPFYSPSYGRSFGYSPFGYGGYDPFYSSYAYGGFGGYGGGYSPFYSPFGYSNFYGGGGGYYGSPVYINNNYITGADPYRNRTYNPSGARTAGRYSSNFDNSPRAYNPNGGRSAYTNSGTAGTSTSSRDAYYARPGNSSRGTNNTTPNAVPSYNSNSNSDYYARPRESSRGSYTPSNGGSRGSSQQQSQPSYQQPSYQSQSRGSYSQPSYQQQSQPSYSAPSRSYSAPSYSAPSSGGSSGGGGQSSGGGGRGPR